MLRRWIINEQVTLHLALTNQQGVAFLRRQPDGVSSPQAIAMVLNLSAEAVRTALAQLERFGVVKRGHTQEGDEEAILNLTALQDEIHDKPL